MSKKEGITSLKPETPSMAWLASMVVEEML
jgi:hypothetical protein